MHNVFCGRGTMGLFLLGVFWGLAIGTVLALLKYYRNPKTCGIIIRMVVFLGFLFPLSITFVLPIDVSSARYNLCVGLGGSEEFCLKPFLYVPPQILDYIWLLTYWNSFLLTWLIVPIIQGYVDTGEFGFWCKIGDSFRSNIRFYAFSITALIIVTIYLILKSTMNSIESVSGFLMALGNAWGLAVAMIFLGHGLVQLPRALWKSADHKRSLARLEFMAPRYKEQLVDAQADLDQVIGEIQNLHRRPVENPSLNILIDELLCTTPLPEIDFINGLAENGAVSESLVTAVVTKSELVKLNYRAKEAVAHRGSSESRWQNLVKKAIHLQDVITNEHGNSGYLWTSSLKRPHPYKWLRFCQWLWYVKLDSVTRRLLSLISVGMSLVILWSECALAVTKADYSIISWIIHWNYLSSLAIELFTLGILLYLAICTYSSFMKVRIFRYYLLVPHHTDEKSLLFFAAYFCRLAFPLGYNYLTLIQGPLGSRSQLLITEFSKIMGPMNLIPVLGDNFSSYFSIGLAIVCVLVFFRMHGWAAQLFSTDPDYSFDDYHAPDHELLSEGRELINSARRQLERSRNRSNDFNSNFESWRSIA